MHANINATKEYLKAIGEYPLLTAEEEIELGHLMYGEDEEKANWARERLINCNQRLVVSIAKSYQNDHLSLLDLIGEGNVGLVKAVGNFNPDAGYRFSTYITPWIKSAISKSIQEQGRNIYIPAHIYNALRKYRQVVTELVGEGYENPSTELIAQKMNITVEKLEELLQYTHDTVSLSTPLGDDSDDTLEDVQADLHTPTPFEVCADKYIKSDMQKLFDEMPVRTATIIKMRFGLGGPEDPVEFKTEHTLDEVGKYLNLSRERVRQIEKQTLKELSKNKKWIDLMELKLAKK